MTNLEIWIFCKFVNFTGYKVQSFFYQSVGYAAIGGIFLFYFLFFTSDMHWMLNTLAVKIYTQQYCLRCKKAGAICLSLWYFGSWSWKLLSAYHYLPHPCCPTSSLSLWLGVLEGEGFQEPFAAAVFCESNFSVYHTIKFLFRIVKKEKFSSQTLNSLNPYWEVWNKY